MYNGKLVMIYFLILGLSYVYLNCGVVMEFFTAEAQVGQRSKRIISQFFA